MEKRLTAGPRGWAAALVSGLLGACGGGGGDATPPTQQAASSDIAVIGSDPGATPFISTVRLSGNSLANLASIDYTVTPKPGSVSKPVHVAYTISALQRKGDVSAAGLQLPVFGLYAGYANQGAIDLQFNDGSVQTLPLVITTSPYADPYGIYDHPTMDQPRAAGSTLGFDFFAIKSALEPTVVVDTDGAIRWVGTGMTASAAVFTNNGFVLGSGSGPQMQRVELDGSVSGTQVADATVLDFTHNIDPGKSGLLAEFDVSGSIDATAKEITPAGAVLQTWDMAALLAAYMRSQGDDPSTFVRPGVDWFHMNSTVYDPSDDSVILSSRENFVVKLDYATGNVIWILGDPTKYWYTFPSLRAKALQLDAGGLYPIGQHALSITSDGLLMLFNDGDGSINMPAGAPAGQTRGYSAVSAYAIDKATMTAHEVWDFAYGQALYSPVCSSAYEAPGKSVLVDYAVADNETRTHLVGLDASHSVVFDMSYANTGSCNTGWNAVPVPFDQMQFE